MSKEKQKSRNILSGLPAIYLILPILFFITSGFLLGWSSRSLVHQPDIAVQNATREGGYKFIGPLLLDIDQTNQDQPFKPLETKLHEATFNILNDPGVNSVEVYFRDLASARSVGIRENDLYDSGSLLKVSILIAALKEAEAKPGFLSKKVIYPGQTESGQTLFSLKPGYAYTIEELLRTMIEQSDNSAKDLLLATLDQSFIDDLFQKLDLSIPDPNASYKISAKTYSYFFRLLYNATYLDQQDSEFAMELLVQTKYKDGLVAGMPQNVAIAHKFGQFNTKTPGNYGDDIWELHDCGIIYYPSRPYFLCVMTRGYDLRKLTEIIKTISQVAYQEVDNNFK